MLLPLKTEFRVPSFWIFLTLLVVGYSAALLYPAAHHDRYHFFYNETLDCSQQYQQVEVFSMGRPFAAAVDCVLTDVVESWAALQFFKLLSLILLMAIFCLLSASLPSELRSWERHLISFLILSLPGFQHSIFMVAIHNLLSFAIPTVAFRIFWWRKPNLKSRDGCLVVGLLFLGDLFYPTFSVTFLMLAAYFWLLDEKNLIRFCESIVFYALATVCYLMLIQGVYKIFHIRSQIYSTKFANPFLKAPPLALEIFEFSLNHFWLTPWINRPWLVVAYSVVLGAPVAILVFRKLKTGGEKWKNLAWVALGVLFTYVALNSPILLTKSGLILHRTIVVGVAFLVSLPILAWHKLRLPAYAERALAATTIPLALAISFEVFSNLQQTAQNSQREIAILREQIGASLDKGIYWIQFKNDFDSTRSYIGVKPSYGDEFRFASGWNLGNLTPMIKLALYDRQFGIQLCHPDKDQPECIRNGLNSGSLVLTQGTTDAALLSRQLRVPYFFLDLTSYLKP